MSNIVKLADVRRDAVPHHADQGCSTLCALV